MQVVIADALEENDTSQKEANRCCCTNIADTSTVDATVTVESADLNTKNGANELGAGAVLQGDKDDNNSDIPSKPLERRTSKRNLTQSALLKDDQFFTGKRPKSTNNCEKDSIPEDCPTLTIEHRFQAALKSLTRPINLGFGTTLSVRDINDIVGRHKTMGNKVLDALIRFSRHLLRSKRVADTPLRVDVFDSKFVAGLTRLHPRLKSDLSFSFLILLQTLFKGVETRSIFNCITK